MATLRGKIVADLVGIFEPTEALQTHVNEVASILMRDEQIHKVFENDANDPEIQDLLAQERKTYAVVTKEELRQDCRVAFQKVHDEFRASYGFKAGRLLAS